MKKLGTTSQNKTVTLTCHQRLKLSFTTHLFFTVLTQFSCVLKNRSWQDFSLICRESNSPRYICRKEDNRQNPQCQNNPDGTSPDQLNVIFARNNPPTPAHTPCQQIQSNHIDHIHSNICIVGRTWRCSGDWVWPSGFSKSRSIALPKSISCKLGSGLRNYRSIHKFSNPSILWQDPCNFSYYPKPAWPMFSTNLDDDGVWQRRKLSGLMSAWTIRIAWINSISPSSSAVRQIAMGSMMHLAEIIMTIVKQENLYRLV